MTHTAKTFLQDLHKSTQEEISYREIDEILVDKSFLQLDDKDFSGMSTEDFDTSHLVAESDFITQSDFKKCNFSDFSFTKDVLIEYSDFTKCFFDKTLFLDSSSRLTFKDCFFKDMKFFSELKKCIFQTCIFENCTFDEDSLKDCTFDEESVFDKCSFLKDSLDESCTIEHCSIRYCTFEENSLKNCFDSDCSFISCTFEEDFASV